MIAGAERRSECEQDRFVGPGGDEDIVRVQAGIEGGDFAAERKASLNVRVAERETVPRRAAFLVCEVEQLLQAALLCVR